jgi:hypothetical protein
MVLMTMLSGSVMAANNRGFLGDIDGCITLTSEDDTLDADKTLYKSELTIYKNFGVGSFSLQPYYYFKDESYRNPMEEKSLNENMLGIDAVIQQTELEKLSTGIAYKYKYRSSGNNDSSFVTRIKLEF